MNGSILVVDEEADFADILSELLTEEGHRVTVAPDEARALDMLNKERFDLVLSDINIAGTRGFALLQEAQRIQPKIKTALVTASDVRDYLYLAKYYNAGAIITKATPFNIGEFKQLVGNLLTGEVFGLERYLRGTVRTLTVSNSTQIDEAIRTVLSAMPKGDHRRRFRQALNEIIVNAIYYGGKAERGDRKDHWDEEVRLGPGEEVLVSWGADSEKTGVAVRDRRGKLTKREVLYWLERNSARDHDGISQGLLDEHGKGLFLSREVTDRFIVNIRRGVMTEIIMLNYRSGVYNGHRPLLILEV